MTCTLLRCVLHSSSVALFCRNLSQVLVSGNHIIYCNNVRKHYVTLKVIFTYGQHFVAVTRRLLAMLNDNWICQKSANVEC